MDNAHLKYCSSLREQHEARLQWQGRGLAGSHYKGSLSEFGHSLGTLAIHRSVIGRYHQMLEQVPKDSDVAVFS